MMHHVTRITDSQIAWENWNLTGFEYKKECLTSLVKNIESQAPNLANVLSYQLQRACDSLSQSYEMVGPTGETNELYTAGRGVALLVQQETGEKAQQAIVAFLGAALAAGNSVIVCSDDSELFTILNSAFEQSLLPANLLLTAPLDTYQSLLEDDVRSVGLVGTSSMELTLNRRLSERTGAIVSLVSETDLQALPIAHDPFLVLRFITERTRTINITAVGGNATLLELGHETH
ncbi:MULTISPECIES: 1-pyrroline-5-carboxylate dehydrogenase [Vibrio]|uniref:1-pyrroline-5-carboxylate dehydrogenase n=2 Tax=Vibrio TaxID=662 RepID=A0A7X4LKD4_9VIBR|nr:MULTISPECIES: 1-pyrroline-5-carboxylate dehydrogenase [Vibrio]MBF9003417.1 1-pyrroline-5-carboxylate dehydrogenase [Vibrio nitrifigilis]MZI93181.1 1-pyrroline-5-carboxylate dehydrogenase [Vibrio eleionomae]